MSARTGVEAELSWPQVLAFRTVRHHLAARSPKRALTTVVGEIGGAQAQIMSAAELQIATRVRCTTADVRTALWQDKTLVKTWLMRGTLHLIPAKDLPLYSAALGPRWIKPQRSWLRYFHMSGEDDLAELVETIGAVLSAEPMTREELIAEVARGRSKRVAQWLRSSWGGLLKPAARSGVLSFGPSRGTNVTFVRPNAWLGTTWRAMDPEAALLELARRYLRAYGPATKRDFARWITLSSGATATAAWSGIAKELVSVSVEGTRMDVLARDLTALARSKLSGSVQLLPLFDPYLMGHVSRDHLFDRVHRWKVSRVAGWISAVVLVDGRVEGTWTHTVSNGTLRLSAAPFGALTARVRSGVEERAEALAQSIGLANVEVTIVRDPPPPRLTPRPSRPSAGTGP